MTLSDPSLTVPLLTSLVPHEKLLTYQFAFDLVEGGAQDFLEAICSKCPEGDDVCGIKAIQWLPYWLLWQKTKEAYDQLQNVLGGQESVKLYLEFLKQNNKVDLLILKNMKEHLEPWSSIFLLKPVQWV